MERTGKDDKRRGQEEIKKDKKKRTRKVDIRRGQEKLIRKKDKRL